MDRNAISDQIDRILRSHTFASKRQLRKLLEVLSQNLDSQTALKPDRVIKELWPQETKTKGSADVATEMNRLRHALESYYRNEGQADLIIIVLPNRATPAQDGSQGKRWIIARSRDEEEHPTAGSRKGRRSLTILAGIAVLGVAAVAAVRMLAVNPRPQSARLDGNVLRIMDADGKELWSKSFPEGFSTDWYYEKGLGRYVWFGDLDEQAHPSVLFSYYPALPPMSRSTVLICYSDRGKEKWRWTPGRELPELAGSPPTFVTWGLGVLKATAEKPPRIVVLSQHQPWWPSQVALLDAHGKTISQYWHSGGLGTMLLADLDGDGRQEILLTGVSEYDHQATLVVLDPERIYGASTEAQQEYQIHGMGAAQERLRLLFQRSDLNRALFQLNAAMEPSVENGKVRLTVAECITPTPGCRIWYEFDKNFHLIAAFAGGDEFRSAHERFYQTGKDAHNLSAGEQAAFQKVRCLVGCKLAYVPVGNLVP